jgi:hypothetical protein
MSVGKKLILLFVVVIASAKVWGQAAPSPFTTFGIGEPYGNGLIQNQGMGVGVAQPQYWSINNQNPALLVYNRFTCFQAGIVGESRKIKGDTLNERSTGGNMNYLVTAFPVKLNKWTTSVGLMPYTNVDFEFQYTKYVNDEDQTPWTVSEKGLGGLTQLYWSNGVRITSDFSVGVKATYLFGSIENSYSNDLDKPLALPISINEKSRYSDFLFGLGLAFSRDSIGGKDYRLSVGAVGTLGTKLNAKTTYIVATTADNDTLDVDNGYAYIPAHLTAGISFSKGQNWSVGTEFSYQDWSKFTSINQDDEGLGKSWRAALGGEFTPDPMALESYFSRVTYRTGVSIEQYPFLANSKEVKDIGINFGFSLPAGRSSLDLAFKVGKRGDKAQNVLEESYFKVYFGITFNDQWFIKRKFD